MSHDGDPHPGPAGALLGPAAVVTLLVCACAAYANLSYAVTSPVDYRFFPPFEPGVNANNNQHLGAEYFNIARSMFRGKGFSSPFDQETGPTAWMPPVLPALLAGLLWACEGDKDAVITVVIFIQVAVLIGTGLLVGALAGQSSRLAGAVAATAYFVGLLCQFHLCFQLTHDSWLVLLALDLLLAGLCWGRPLRSLRAAVGWGVFGGLCALVSPALGLTWGMLSLAAGGGRGARLRRQPWPPG